MALNSPLYNRGVFGGWVASLPATSSILVMDTSGNVSTTTTVSATGLTVTPAGSQPFVVTSNNGYAGFSTGSIAIYDTDVVAINDLRGLGFSFMVAGTSKVSFSATGVVSSIGLSVTPTGSQPFIVTTNNGYAGFSTGSFAVFDADVVVIDDVRGLGTVFRSNTVQTATLSASAGLGVVGAITAKALSSTSTMREQAALVGSWVTSTDATRKAQCEEKVYDTAARTVARSFANGTNGYKAFKVLTTAPADADLAVSEVVFYTNGSGDLVIKLKDSGGTVRTGTVDLS